VCTTSGTYPWSYVTHIFHSCQPSHGCDHTTFKVMTLTEPMRTQLFYAQIYLRSKCLVVKELNLQANVGVKHQAIH
jgi:hypothetical protein